ncbi:hypothetical protein DYI24_13405 [Rhodopseudomonas sp. BR0C11]|uniref:hypothetical protein n=1 Tax=Rhodopseudomonas sp. BR0C11 TaxID=2269370 RepID=UPI0013E0A5AC|nr:hypothetical protein [Rhodopseudomonas sp. BR0C11]NEV78035.1 hypothetical protein [Rhodopseudomonas sp. BR0C11]
MSLRFKQLRLRAVTADGIYGVDIPFKSGLNVLWADNTRGKSMCMQGMLYSLGLEKMLSPKREIPLPHAMTRYLNTDDNRKIDIIESRVSLEIQNGAGQTITVNRGVKADTDPRLITVEFGAALSEGTSNLKQQHFFVSDAGAAQREDGFHFFLENFLGWHLPQVRRYDAPESKLYLETVFPLFWVEQKFGWSAIPAAIPTYMRIREVHKRSVEFLMALDVHNFELQRERLSEQLNVLAQRWSETHSELARTAARAGARLRALSEIPVADPEALAASGIEIANDEQWIPLEEKLTGLRKTLNKLTTQSIPTVEDNSEETARRLGELLSQADTLNNTKLELHNIHQIKFADISSLQRRIATLSEDLAKNQDVQRLQRYSGVAATLTPQRCPTCDQALHDTLLSQNAITAVMPIADNIEYIRSQKKMFEDILRREKLGEKKRLETLATISNALKDVYAEIRTLRAELVAPSSSPSAVSIQERIKTEAKIRELENLQSAFDETMSRLRDLQSDYRRLKDELNRLPNEKFSADDKDKLKLLTNTIIDQASDFGFKTFPPEELSVSEDSYRPEKEGFEIGFETSASDSIRLKWAYQLGLLELSSLRKTNHPGTLIFDEPRQQSLVEISFERLLKRAAQAKARGQQVIFSTSEDRKNLNRITQQLDCSRTFVEGYILKKIQDY